MYNRDLINPMLTGEQLIEALRILPKYDDTIRDRDKSTRLVALSDLYNIYLPSVMSEEIYSKLYLSFLRSLNKKDTVNVVRQENENFKAIHQKSYKGIIGGSDSFTIVGCSGIGKSSAISRAVDLITDKTFVEFNNTKICAVVVVQCPFDSSVKGLAFEILRKIDDALETKYYTNALRSHATTDILIGIISQVALNHIGLLIIDSFEIALLGNFLNITPKDLQKESIIEKPQYELFDKQIIKLHKEGLSYPQIANKMGLSLDTIKNAAYISKRKAKPRARKGVKPGRRPIDWESLDSEMLPKVVETIAELKSSEKPQRITLGGVARLVGLKSKQIDKLTQCKAEIMRNCQSQEVYWAQKVLWAWGELSKEGRIISIKQMRLKTNMSTEQIRRTMAELSSVNKEVYEQLSKLL